MRTLLAVILMAAASLAFAQATEVPRADPATEQRLRVLAEELRCLVCQNQTIADSNAPLALDLRSQIRTQIGQGRSDNQIRDYMVERYGDFVLYKPPLKATTAVLWLGPIALTVGGWLLFAHVVRRRREAHAAGSQPPVPEKEKARIASLLEGTESAPATTPEPGRPRGPKKPKR